MRKIIQHIFIHSALGSHSIRRSIFGVTLLFCLFGISPALHAQVLTVEELKPITQKLKNLSIDDRKAACKELMALGAKARRALPQLNLALQRESNLEMRRLLRQTIQRIQGLDDKDNLYLRIQQIDGYIKQLRHPNRGVRRQAATLLAGFGADAAHAVKPLKELANTDPDEFNRRMAQQSIQKIEEAVAKREADKKTITTTQPSDPGKVKLDPADQLVYDQLRVMLDEEIPERRLDALKGLRSMGAKVYHLRDLFKTMALEDKNADVRIEAGITLREVLADYRQQKSAPEDQRALQVRVYALIADLGSGDAQTRLRAVKALGNIGKPAEKAIPQLEQMVLDPDERSVISNAAKEALKKIKGD